MIVVISLVKMNSIKHLNNSKIRLVINPGTNLLLLCREFVLNIDFFSETKPSRSHLTIMVAHNDDPTNLLAVRFTDSGKKVGVAEVKEYLRRMEDENLTNTILVVQIGLSPAARDVHYFIHIYKNKKIDVYFFLQLIQNGLENQKIQIQVFLEDELLVNITEHNVRLVSLAKHLF